MIKLSGLEKIYPGQNGNGNVVALKDVDISVKKGEIFGIIGKSGAGKSTLIRCINMLEHPTKGTVIVDGKELSSLDEKSLRQARKKIGMIFQHFNLLSSRTVYENVAFPLELDGMDKNEISEQVLPLLELVGLTDKKDQYPAQLSGGQKQRVGIARALANNPKVLLCDEATSALDPQTTKSILALLKDINKKLQLTIVLITHEMQVVKDICHNVAVIENGDIIEQGAVLDIFAKPQHPSTKEFLKAVFNHDLPDIFNNIILEPKDINCLEIPPDANLILRISFIGASATKPIITDIIKRFNVTVSILYGNTDYLQETLFGTLIIELSGDAANIQSALNYLRARDLRLEVIGYVRGNASAVS